MLFSKLSRTFARTLSAAAIFSAALTGCAEDPGGAGPAVDDGAKRALFVVSNVGTMTAPGYERDTGVWFSEVAHPYWELRDAEGTEFEIDIASPEGGEAPIDSFSVKLNLDDYLASGGTVVDSGDPGNERFLGDAETRGLVEARDVQAVDQDGQPITMTTWTFVGTLALADVRAEDYDVVYYAGGNGASWQFPGDAQTQRVAAEMYEAGKLVTAACHGTGALLDVQVGGGYLVDGLRVTGFSNAEEEQLGQKDIMPVLLEDEFPERGALYEAAPAWSNHVVVDGRVITGQNPPSAGGVGEAITAYFAAQR